MKLFHFFTTVRVEDYLVLSDVFWKENGGRKKMLKCDSGAPTGGEGRGPRPP